MKTPTIRSTYLPLVAIGMLCQVSATHSQGTMSEQKSSDDSTDQKTVLATVNGEDIYLENLESVLSDIHQSAQADLRGSMTTERLIFRMVNDTLLAQEARILGMQNEEPIPTRREALRARLATERLLNEEIEARIAVSNEEVQRAFEHEYSTVTLRIATRFDEEEAKQLLQDALEAEDFEQLVRDRSEDRWALRGGLIENITRMKLPPEIEEQAFQMEVGEIRGPLRTALGWAIIKVESFSDADPQRFEAVEGRVRSMIAFRKAEARRREFDQELREHFAVNIDQEVYDSIKPNRIVDGRMLPTIDSPDAVVATIGERTISAKKFGAALGKRWSGVRNEEAAAATKGIVLTALISDELIIAEALRRGYHSTKEVDRAVSALETRMMVDKYLQEVVSQQVHVSSDEMQEYFEEHREEFRRPPLYSMAQITVATQEQAEEIADLAKEGADFAWLARQHSQDRFKESGGDRGWMPPQEAISAFGAELRSAESGDVIGPHGDSGFFRIAKVTAIEDRGLYSFDEVSGNVKSRIWETRSREVLDQVVSTLRERSEITIHEDALESLEIDASRQAGGDSAHDMAPVQ